MTDVTLPNATGPEFSFILLHVADPIRSAAFYADLIGAPIVEQAPTFAMVPLREGVMLGLWLRDGVEPRSVGRAGVSEVAFTVADAAAVEATHTAWVANKISILQTPTKMDFGTTFVAADPDGHWLRVFAPGA